MQMFNQNSYVMKKSTIIILAVVAVVVLYVVVAYNGLVSKQEMTTIGGVGQAARASGLKRDIRATHPSGFYAGAFSHNPVMRADGDVMSRLATRMDEVLQSADYVLQTLESYSPKGNMVVFSATTSTQTAHPYLKQSHGLFTYYMLKWLKTNYNNISLGSWYDYIRSNVASTASKDSDILKEQHPSVAPSPELGKNWRNITL
mgnify:CR=1 FL=1